MPMFDARGMVYLTPGLGAHAGLGRDWPQQLVRARAAPTSALLRLPAARMPSSSSLCTRAWEGRSPLHGCCGRLRRWRPVGACWELCERAARTAEGVTRGACAGHLQAHGAEGVCGAAEAAHAGPDQGALPHRPHRPPRPGARSPRPAARGLCWQPAGSRAPGAAGSADPGCSGPPPPSRQPQEAPRPSCTNTVAATILQGERFSYDVPSRSKVVMPLPPRTALR